MLEVRSVSKSFGGVHALRRVSLTVEPASIHGLIGPNGAGKSTLFNVVTGLDRPDEGSVVYDGRRTDGLRTSQLAALGLARTFQNLGLFQDLSVIENVLVGRYRHGREGIFRSLVRSPRVRRRERADRVVAEEILETVGLANLANERVSALPYGFQKRVELARCLAMEPKLLLLDEPAAGMNTGEKHDLMRVIRNVQDRGVTIVLTEHDMDVVMSLATRVTVLNFGAVIADDTPEGVRRSQAVIDAYLGVAETDRKSPAQ